MRRIARSHKQSEGAACRPRRFDICLLTVPTPLSPSSLATGAAAGGGPGCYSPPAPGRLGAPPASLLRTELFWWRVRGRRRVCGRAVRGRSRHEKAKGGAAVIVCDDHGVGGGWRGGGGERMGGGLRAGQGNPRREEAARRAADAAGDLAAAQWANRGCPHGKTMAEGGAQNDLSRAAGGAGG